MADRLTNLRSTVSCANGIPGAEKPTPPRNARNRSRRPPAPGGCGWETSNDPPMDVPDGCGGPFRVDLAGGGLFAVGSGREIPEGRRATGFGLSDRHDENFRHRPRDGTGPKVHGRDGR